MNTRKALIALTLVAGLSACNSGREDATTGDEVVNDTDAGSDGAGGEEAPVSILRPDVEQPKAAVEVLPALDALVGFPDGGSELSADAVAALEGLLASPQIKLDRPILISAHSDAGGSDAANARASEARGLAVAAWLIENGVDEDRIQVIVFGEQNPVEPNALPNGEPNVEGRAANRRVEVLIAPALNSVSRVERLQPTSSD